jgi:hypothetical protein
MPRTLYPRERPGTHCIGGWETSGAGLDISWKSRLPPGFDPRRQPVVSRYTVWAIQTHDRRGMNKNIYSFEIYVLVRCERSVTGCRCIQDEIIPVSTSSRATVRGACSVNPASCLTCSRLLRNIWENGPVDIVTRLRAGQSTVRFPVGILIYFLPTTSKPVMGSASRHVHWSGGGMKLTTHLNLAPVLRINGAMFQILHKPLRLAQGQIYHQLLLHNIDDSI